MILYGNNIISLFYCVGAKEKRRKYIENANSGLAIENIEHLYFILPFLYLFFILAFSFESINFNHDSSHWKKTNQMNKMGKIKLKALKIDWNVFWQINAFKPKNIVKQWKRLKKEKSVDTRYLYNVGVFMLIKPEQYKIICLTLEQHHTITSFLICEQLKLAIEKI